MTPTDAFRQTLLFLARQRRVQRLVMGHDLLRGVAQRFVAGDDLADGIAVASALNVLGLRVTLDHLGESVVSEADARGATAHYLMVLDAIARERVAANISLKLTQLGLDISRDVCVTNLRRILDHARGLGLVAEPPARPDEDGIFVRIDMESSAYTQRTLDVHAELWEAGYRNVGVVLQAALYRTAADVEQAIERGVRVRLCKGAYLESPRVAYAEKAAVDANYARLAERLLLHGTYPALATHDHRLIRHAQDVARRERVTPERFEFQMLFGVRRDLQSRLARQGYRVRIYVPYGSEWYPYLVRRLAERPANVAFMAQSLLRELAARSEDGRAA